MEHKDTVSVPNQGLWHKVVFWAQFSSVLPEQKVAAAMEPSAM